MSGWKRVTSFTRWNYFCKEVEKGIELPDIYSEKDTKVQNEGIITIFRIDFNNYITLNV